MDGPKFNIVIVGQLTKSYEKNVVADQVGLVHKLSGPADLKNNPQLPSSTNKTIDAEGEVFTFQITYLPTIKQNELQLKESHVILFTFSILDANTLKEIAASCLPEVTTVAPSIPRLLVGIGKDKRIDNSTYLSKFKKKCMPYEDITVQATQMNLRYLECSLKTNEGLQEIWEEILKNLPSQKSSKSPKSLISKLGNKIVKISNKHKPPDKASRKSEITTPITVSPPLPEKRRTISTADQHLPPAKPLPQTPPEEKKVTPKSATISKGSNLKSSSTRTKSFMLEHDATNYVIDFDGKTLDQLKNQIAKALGRKDTDFFIEEHNKKFDRFVKVTDINQLEDGMIIRIKSGKLTKSTTIDDDAFNIDYNEIKMGPTIGKGAFGEVFKARWRNCDCVVKQLKITNQDETSIAQFKKETDIVKKLRNHKNVCTVFGVCTNPQYPICIVMEYIEGGSLKNLVYDDTFPMDVLTVIRFAKDVASGMSHIHKENLLHCDLACRNLLYESKGNNKYVIKVTDFGLARLSETGLYNASVGSLFPIRWSAPEVLAKQIVSRPGDVWSFGVVLWEISEGKVPYHGLENPQVLEHVVDNNQILLPPKRVKSPELYNIMKLCWERIPEKRPTFDDLFVMLEDLETKLEGVTNSSGENANDNSISPVYFSTSFPNANASTSATTKESSATTKDSPSTNKKDTKYSGMNVYRLLGKKDKDKEKDKEKEKEKEKEKKDKEKEKEKNKEKDKNKK